MNVLCYKFFPQVKMQYKRNPLVKDTDTCIFFRNILNTAYIKSTYSALDTWKFIYHSFQPSLLPLQAQKIQAKQMMSLDLLSVKYEILGYFQSFDGAIKQNKWSYTYIEKVYKKFFVILYLHNDLEDSLPSSNKWSSQENRK